MKHSPGPARGGKLNEYRILEKMAAGSFGVIFKVRRVTDDAILVMKRIALADLDAEQRREAAQETHVMSRLHHPYIVAQRDAFLFKDSLCIVMDYYDDGDLAALITRQREKDEYLPMEQTLAWFAEVNLAMHYLHDKGIVHRDLKTHNLFLNSDSGEVAVGDFGVAEFVGAAGGGTSRSPFTTPLTPVSRQLFARRRDSELFGDGSTCSSGGDAVNGPFGGAVRGTLLYMAPEVLESGVCSPSSDVWSLGCILYELLSLRHPFESRDIAALMVRVMAGARPPPPAHYPAEVVQLLDRMLSLDAARRPSCEEILRSPVMSASLQKVVEQRASRTAHDPEAARTWAAQLQRLGIHSHAPVPRLPYLRERRPALPPSRERALAEPLAVLASPRPELPPSPYTPSLGRNLSPTWVPPLPLRLDQGHSPRPRDKEYVLDTEREKRGDGAGDTFSRSSWKPGGGNVEDMRHMPLELIEAEVARYRQLVQSEMRRQKRQRDAALHESRFGREAAPTKYYYNSLARLGHSTTTPFGIPQTHQTVMSSGPLPPSSSPSPLPVPAPGWEKANIDSQSSAVAARWPQGSLEASLAARRQRRMEAAIGVLGSAVFFAVYTYYRSVEVAEREVAFVMQLVPDRTQWHVLPVVEEVVVIDRLLERMGATGT
ncbi:putative protein kinase [Trypanosoma conorhini]|uniref:non-specific serine/threonine protein kinase n=1 Tax=Trypanosoma conorhini TaxID=83891 RepID=A0A3R7PWG4_9TRYP|nr:putative protein kinase [Trypanosoma conorhini]RNF26204.1 putative protein kinase [Trypanosoma conorhini]